MEKGRHEMIPCWGSRSNLAGNGTGIFPVHGECSTNRARLIRLSWYFKKFESLFKVGKNELFGCLKINLMEKKICLEKT